MRKKHPWLAVLVVSSLAGLALACSGGAPPADAPPVDDPLPLPSGREAAEQSIDADILKRHVETLSADDMGGRAPGSPGDEQARRYIASAMADLGLEPAGAEGAWEQRFDIVSVEAEVPPEWSFSESLAAESLPARGPLVVRSSDEFVAFSGVHQPEARIDAAELVFVGYGIIAPEYQWDDYKGAELTGKVLVMMNNDPDWDSALFEGERRLYYGRWDYKYESAARQGAVGAIIIHTTPSAGYGWQVVQSSWTGEQFDLPAGSEPRLQIGAWLTEDATRRLFAHAGLELDELLARARQRDFSPVPMGLVTSFALHNRVHTTQTANVLGRLAGSDPALAQEVVIYSAHHDHLGNGGPPPDPIYNGALDNASGVAQVLAIARAMTVLPRAPRRSILFAFVAAEESGLLGSAYYASHPTVRPGRIAANLNFDGASIWGRTRDVTYIGYGKSSLDAVVEAAAALQERTVFSDQFPDRGFFYRSDQFNFARIGVPAIYLDAGTDVRDKSPEWGREQIEAWEAQHYHQPSDELDGSWNWDGVIEDAQLGLYCGLAIAERSELPAWRPGDEFEAARLQALAAVQAAP